MKRPPEKEFRIPNFTVSEDLWGCHIPRVMIEYIKEKGKKKGGQTIERFLENCPYSEEHLTDMNETFAGDWGREFYRRSRVMFDDPEIIRKMFHEIPMLGNNLLLTMIKLLGTPKLSVTKIPEFNKKYNKTAKCKVVAIEKDEAILIWTYAQNIKKYVSADEDNLIIGSISGITSLWDLPDIQLTHPKSTGKIHTYGSIDGKVYRTKENNEVIEYDSDIIGNIVNPDTGKVIGELNDDGTFKLGETIYGTDYCEFHLKWTNRKFWDLFLDRLPLYKQAKKSAELAEAKKTLEEQLESSNKQYEILAATREREQQANKELQKTHTELQQTHTKLQESASNLEEQYAEVQRLFGELQTQRTHEKRLEELMTGGFAHEIRNSLTGPQYMLKALQNYKKKGKSVFEVIELLGGFDSAFDESLFYLQKEFDIPVTVIDEKIKKIVDQRASETLSHNLEEIQKNYNIPDEVIAKIIVNPYMRILAMDDVKKAIDISQRNIERALSTTTTIRDYSKVSKLERGEEVIDVYELAVSYNELNSDMIKKLKVNYSVHTSNGKREIKGKKDHIDSIVGNLVRNAIEANEDVTKERNVDVYLSGVIKDKVQYIRIMVKDTGEGIPKDNMQDIFEPFWSTKPTTGTGLGLSWVCKLVVIYGGTIDVKSEVGKGTTFTVDLNKNG